MVQTRKHVFFFVCWAGCLLALVMLAEYGMISHSRARIMGREIAHRVRGHHRRDHRARTPDFWKRPLGRATLRACSGRTAGVATTRFAVVSILTLDDGDMYTQGAITLAHSLRWWLARDQLDLVLMITSGFGVASQPDYDQRAGYLLAAGWNTLCWVPVVEHPRAPHGNRFHDMRAYSRLNLWGLTEYDAVLSLDIDTLAIRDPSPIFTQHLPAMLAANQTLGAVRDRPARLSHNFNAGVLLVIPDQNVMASLIDGMSTVPHEISWAEQAYLNTVFNHSFYVLPYRYNANLVSKSYEPALWRQEKSIVHYTISKPWQSFRHPSFQYQFVSCWFWDVDDMCQLWDMLRPP